MAKHILTTRGIRNVTIRKPMLPRFQEIVTILYYDTHLHVFKRSCFCVIRFLFHAGTSFHLSSSCLLVSSSFCQIHNHHVYTVCMDIELLYQIVTLKYIDTVDWTTGRHPPRRKNLLQCSSLASSRLKPGTTLGKK